MRRRLLLRGGNRWWLLRTARAELDDAVAGTCRMSLAKLTGRPGGYDIHTARETLHLDAVFDDRVVTVVFRGAWRTSKKALLIKKLLRKQFEPIIPRLHIRLQRTR